MVKWTNPAKKDLKNIFHFISKDSTFYAKRVANDIADKSSLLNDFPEMGRTVPEIGDPQTREIFAYSYRIVDEIRTDGVYILAVVHGKRDLPSAFPSK